MVSSSGRPPSPQDQSATFTSPHTARLDFGAGYVSYHCLPPHTEDGFTSTSDAYAFGVSFTGHRSAVVRAANGQAAAWTFAPGTVGLNDGQPLDWLHVAEPSEGLEIHPDATLLRSVAEQTGCNWNALGGFLQMAPDPVMWAAGIRFRRAVRSASAVEPFDADALIHNVVHHLAVAHFGGRRPRAFRGRLDRARLDRAVAYLRAHQDRRVSLAELAGVAAMSPYHFQRAFKVTTGLSPGDYAASLRAEQAHRLLAEGATLHVAGAAVGVKDGSYLRRILRRYVGSPG